MAARYFLKLNDVNGHLVLCLEMEKEESFFGDTNLMHISVYNTLV